MGLALCAPEDPPRNDWACDAFEDIMAENGCIGGSGRLCMASEGVHDSVKPFRILCFGDSLTAGFCDNGSKFQPYGLILKEFLSDVGINVQVSVCGFNGHTACQMAAELASDCVTDVCGQSGQGLQKCLEEKGPFDLVLIMAGTNDLRVYTVDKIIFSIQQLHRTCHELLVPTVALSPPSPVVVPKKMTRMVLADWAHSTPSVMSFIDPEQLIPRSHLKFWEPDELHFSPVGSSMLGQQLVSKLLPLLCKLGVRKSPEATRDWTAMEKRMLKKRELRFQQRMFSYAAGGA